MALAIAKYIKIKRSIRAVTKELKKSINARIYNDANKREVIMKPKISNEVKNILEIILPYQIGHVRKT